jgi:hypothetical protein
LIQTKSVFQDPCTIAPHLWPSSRVYNRCSSFLIGSCEMVRHLTCQEVCKWRVNSGEATSDAFQL